MNGLKSQPPESSNESGPQISGKLVIICVLAIAITGAAVSWFFRYNATHRAARFWGPEAARQIRDAPVVTLYFVNDDDKTLATVGDVSSAKGITHLRNALLEDHNFNWPERSVSQPPKLRWALGFTNPGQQRYTLTFTEDFKQIVRGVDQETVLSCEPMADGLREMFDELLTEASAKKRAESVLPPR